MFLDVRGHDDVAERFRRLLANGRLASTYLLVGPEGIGKRHFAVRMAHCLLCSEREDRLLDCCGHCDACRLTAAGNHPDLEIVQRREDRQELTVDVIIGDREHRNRQGLCHWLALAPTLGTRRIAIIDDADYFNEESANALLKTLEEPPRRALILLVGTTANRQLPTIRSRCQVVRFRPLGFAAVNQLLLQDATAGDRQQAERLAELSGGSLARAREIADDAVLRFRDQLDAWLSAPRIESVKVSRAVREFVESAGTEARVRRARLRVVMVFAAEYYRRRLRWLAGADVPDRDPTRPRVDQPEVTGHATDVDRCLRRLDRCLDAILQLERYANQTLLIDCWVDDLAQI